MSHRVIIRGAHALIEESGTADLAEAHESFLDQVARDGFELVAVTVDMSATYTYFFRAVESAPPAEKAPPPSQARSVD